MSTIIKSVLNSGWNLLMPSCLDKRKHLPYDETIQLNPTQLYFGHNKASHRILSPSTHCMKGLSSLGTYEAETLGQLITCYSLSSTPCHVCRNVQTSFVPFANGFYCRPTTCFKQIHNKWNQMKLSISATDCGCYQRRR